MNVSTVANAIARVGKAATLRRVAGPLTFVSVGVKAVVRAYQPNELQGAIIQGDRQARISNVEIGARQWPGPPRRGDQLILDGRTYNVQGVDSPNIGEDTAMHIIQVRGAA
jgi:hypothetical protein